MTKKFVDGVAVDLTVEEENLLNQRLEQHNANAFNRALDILRQKRKPLLEETDWMANSDVTMSTAWKNYRQALRDITTQTPTDDALSNISFPKKPTS